MIKRVGAIARESERKEEIRGKERRERKGEGSSERERERESGHMRGERQGWV